MTSKISFRLLVFFAAALLFFASVSGLLFRSLFASAVSEAKREEILAAKSPRNTPQRMSG